MNRIKIFFAFSALLIIAVGCNQASIKPDATVHPSNVGIDVTRIHESVSPTPKKTLSTPLSTVNYQVETERPPISTLETKLTGDLYLWMPRFEEPLYTSIDLSSDLPVNLDTRVSPPELVASDKRAVGLAFAPYSSKVAYVTKSTDSTDLWVSDLNFMETEHLGKLDREWLGPIEIPGDIKIKWGPLESSLILSSSITKDHLMIYSFITKQVYEGNGACDKIAPLPDSKKITVWCSFNPSSSLPYGYFSLDGKITFTDQRPQQEADILEWSFSADGKTLVYIPKEGDTIIVGDQGNILEVPIRLLNEPGGQGSQPFLQWSANGEHLLVYGYNPEGCPMVENPLTGDLEAKECWQVVNPSTGELLWAPNKDIDQIEKATGFPIEQLLGTCAGISPDGGWVLLCYRSGAIEDTVIINLKNSDEIKYLGPVNFLDLKWVNYPS